MLDANDIKKHFPIFTKHPDLVYLDSAATTFKPESVIAREREYYEEYGANVARGLYPLSERATREYEQTRELTAQFVHAARTEEIVFTKGTTDAINLIASSMEGLVGADDEVLVTLAEHHSNFLPWQALAARTGATFKALPVDTETGFINLDTLKQFVTPKTKLFSFHFVSNVLGVIQPVQAIIAKAKALNPNILVIVEAAQAAAHVPLDVQALGCDFLAFSAHKMFGPTGVGVLWGRYNLLEQLPPYQYGGEMVLEAGVERSTFKQPPHKFEAGTPNIAGVIAFQEAIRFVQSLGWDAIRAHEIDLISSALEQLATTFGEAVRIIGSRDATKKSGVIAFDLKGIHPHDIAGLLGERGICIRAGQHCAHPLHTLLSAFATARLSISVYTEREDIDQLVKNLKEIMKKLEMPTNGNARNSNK